MQIFHRQNCVSHFWIALGNRSAGDAGETSTECANACVCVRRKETKCRPAARTFSVGPEFYYCYTRRRTHTCFVSTVTQLYIFCPLVPAARPRGGARERKNVILDAVARFASCAVRERRWTVGMSHLCSRGAREFRTSMLYADLTVAQMALYLLPAAAAIINFSLSLLDNSF